MRTVCHGEVELAYELVNDGPGEPMLLVCGNATQQLHWPAELLDGLAARGFRVATFDNRDSGRSTHLPDGPPYSLADMADDAVAVLDALGWSSAHVLGPSLGGMICQQLAIRHPSRVRSVTSVSSAAGWGLRFSRPRLRTVLRVLAVAAGRGAGRDAAVAKTMRMFRLMTTPSYPLDEDRVRTVAAAAHDIDHDEKAVLRQQRAAARGGDRRAELRAVRAPVLVVHGGRDPMQAPSAGRATAAAVPGARLLMLPDVGHYLPPQLWPGILDELCDLLGRRSGRPEEPRASE